MIDDLIALANRLASASPAQASAGGFAARDQHGVLCAVPRHRKECSGYPGRCEEGPSIGASLGTSLSRVAARRRQQRVRGMRNQSIAPAIKDCADAFVRLQQARHATDCDPLYRLSRAAAIEVVRIAPDAIEKLLSAPSQDRRAFAVQVLVKKRAHG